MWHPGHTSTQKNTHETAKYRKPWVDYMAIILPGLIHKVASSAQPFSLNFQHPKINRVFSLPLFQKQPTQLVAYTYKENILLRTRSLISYTNILFRCFRSHFGQRSSSADYSTYATPKYILLKSVSFEKYLSYLYCALI